MSCECQTGRRDLLIIPPQDWDELETYRAIADRMDWSFAEEARLTRIPLGQNCPHQSTAEVANFLRTEFECPLDDFDAAVVSPGASLGDRMDSLDDLAEDDSTPLLDMLENRAIDTWYQPVFELDTLDHWGHECLMRGRSNDGETISPVKILQWAEQERLQFMLDRVCREIHLRNASRDIESSTTTICINFLPTAIYNPEVCLRTTRRVAEQMGIPFDRVVFEVVETEEVDDREQLVDILEYYRNAGFRIALDDVGAGYSGLTMLAELDPDIIKLDRGIVEKVADSDPHRSICNSLVEFARRHGSLVLAEGIESPDQIDALADLGVDLVQGYLFGRPAPEPSSTSDWHPDD